MGDYPSRQGLNDRRGFNPPSFAMDPWDDHPVVCSACGGDLLGVWFDAPGGAFCDASCAAPVGPARDLRAAFAARDEAIDRVDRAADPGWREAALAAVLAVARRQDELTTDDVWIELGSSPDDLEPRAMGPIMLAARRRRWVETTNRTRQAERVVNHARPQRIWRSLVS